jgi:hypothetical protein
MGELPKYFKSYTIFLRVQSLLVGNFSSVRFKQKYKDQLSLEGNLFVSCI